MTLTNAAGVFAIAPTPFAGDGGIDLNSIDRLSDFHRECGCAGLTVLGIMGEAPKLDTGEAVSVATRFIRRYAPAPVIVGASAPGFAAMRALSHQAMDAERPG